jgi:isoleucyl-tRNA synthetase
MDPARAAAPGFAVLDSGIHHAREEEAILAFWRDARIFARSVEERDESRPFVFYEGPPTTNGRPGVHHVLGRTVKDLICRFWTMEGCKVRRKGGWDTHGLPVEIEVEKELGIDGKNAIETFGVAEFNARCRKSVFKYKDEWDQITERIGFWLDLESPYVTLDNDYIESVWWCLKQFWDKGRMYAGFKVVPYCPRCQTALSDHEVSQGYKTVTDPAVTVKFAVEGEPDTFILAWTTTPWTLPGNVALAVGPDIPYVKAEENGAFYYLAKDRMEVLSGEAAVAAELPGRALVGKRYRPLFDGLDLKAMTGKDAYYVAPADFVTTDEGTGVVHTAVMYGADDYALGRTLDLPMTHTVDETGRFTAFVPGFAGERVRAIDPEIVAYLEAHGLLYAREEYEHTYPFCWRCDSALLYYARHSWYLQTTAIKDAMLAENAAVQWFPAQVGENRFGNWLENNVDWSISRDRYWGTPLPLWECETPECEHRVMIGGRDDLVARGGTVPGDLHRPYIDDVTLECSACGGALRRVPEVIDVWFDSGSMPFAQWHYPFENKDVFRADFPADFISEGIDQSRGWFYSLLAIGTMIMGKSPFRAVVSNELILDAEGRKMSKRLGNTVDSWEILNAEGADALRWYLVANSPPWVSKRFSREGVTEVARRFFGTLRNIAAFLATYANVDGWTPPGSPPPAAERPVLDRWVLSRLDTVAASMREDLRGYQITRAARTLSAYIQDEVSNWYVRRNRRRFWKGETGPDKEAAYATLHEVLATTARLMAPIAPFLAETLHRTLVTPFDGNAPDSVHLAAYPAPGSGRRDPSLEESMSRAIAVTELVRAARSQAGIKVRVPLPAVKVLGGSPLDASLLEIVRDEVNVKAVEFTCPEAVTAYRLKPDFKALGPRFGGDVNRVAAAVKALDSAAVEAGMKGDAWEVSPPDLDPVVVRSSEVRVEETSAPGYVVVAEGELKVALDTRVSPELEREGWIRELVHRIQNQRKDQGLLLTDRIHLRLGVGEAIRDTVESHREFIEAEVLARSLELGPPDPGHEAWVVDGTDVTVFMETAAGRY